jgi:hypothetical protein
MHRRRSEAVPLRRKNQSGPTDPAGATHRTMPRPQIAAYYFPNYHADARNRIVHGEGWTEWELVKAARPRWPGHRQPNAPLWGETDEADPADMARKIDAAADHGIDAFIFDWYHYEDGPFLERGLEEGFLRAPNRARLKFALMWANHDWVDIHPQKLGEIPRVLYPGPVGPAKFAAITDLVVRRYFSQPNYWRIGGRPYFSFYELDKLVTGLGGVDATAEALRAFRGRSVAAGHGDPHFNLVFWQHSILQGERASDVSPELVRRLGFDSVGSYVWIHHFPVGPFPAMDYADALEAYLGYCDKTQPRFAPLPFLPNVTMGWDASPRTVQSDRFEARGYPFMGTLRNNSPRQFRLAAERLGAWVAAREPDPILTFNAWNEWTEGSYLEPDTVSGFAYLEAIRAVFGVRGGDR